MLFTYLVTCKNETRIPSSISFHKHEVNSLYVTSEVILCFLHVSASFYLDKKMTHSRAQPLIQCTQTRYTDPQVTSKKQRKQSPDTNDKRETLISRLMRTAVGICI